MSMYARDEPSECHVIDRWNGGVGWLAHPDEDGKRASHAVRGDDGVWVIDPLDAPGVDELLAELGEVAGVAVLSSYHARDAAVFAERYGVSVYVPRWMNRVEKRTEAPIERFGWSLGNSGFAVQRLVPIPGWPDAIAYRESDRTLYVPDTLGTAPSYTVGTERIGVYFICRLFPPRSLLADIHPERILVGHGEGIFADAVAALADSLDGSRRRFPRALLTTGWTQLRAATAAFGNTN